MSVNASTLYVSSSKKSVFLLELCLCRPDAADNITPVQLFLSCRSVGYVMRLLGIGVVLEKCETKRPPLKLNYVNFGDRRILRAYLSTGLNSVLHEM